MAVSKLTLEKYLVQLRRIPEHREAKAEQNIRYYYNKLLKELNGFLGEEYAKLAEDDKLTYAILQREGEYARFLQEVEARINDLTPKAAAEIRQAVNETYKVVYNGMVDAVKKSTDATSLAENLKGVKAATPEIIKQAVQNPVSGLTLKDTLEKNRKEIIYSIKQTIGVGLVNGDRMSTMARRISDEVDKDYRKAIRIARTEVHRVREAGNQDAATEIDGALQNGQSCYRLVKIWRNMKDNRVRPQVVRKTKKGVKVTMRGNANHVKMEGQTVLADEPFDLGDGVKAMTPGQSGVAAHDCNCRCFVEYVLMNDEEYFKATGKHFPDKEKEKEKVVKEKKSKQPKELTEEQREEIRGNIRSKHSSFSTAELKELDENVKQWNDDILRLYDKLSDNFGSNDYNYKGGSYYTAGLHKACVDMSNNAKERHLGQRKRYAWHTKFHEEFHQLDNILGSDMSPMTKTSRDSGKALAAAIKEDIFDACLPVAKRLGYNPESFDKLNERTLRTFAMELSRQNSTSQQRAQISLMTDALGLATKGKVDPYSLGFWGHDANYNRKGIAGATSEVWANYGGVILSNDKESEAVLRKLMPKTMSACDSLLQDAMKKRTIKY